MPDSNPAGDVVSSSGYSGSASARRLAAGEPSFVGVPGDCLGLFVFDGVHIPDIWSFAGTVGVTLLIMESGMHINFDKVRQIGGKALVVAIIGTPLSLGKTLETCRARLVSA